MVIPQFGDMVVDGCGAEKARPFSRLDEAQLHKRRGSRRDHTVSEDHRRALARAGVPPLLEGGEEGIQLSRADPSGTGGRIRRGLGRPLRSEVPEGG